MPAKAKAAPTDRFDALDDKVYRMDVRWHAYQCGRANDGKAGVDGQTFEDIEAYGVMTWLGEWAEELRQKTYRPQAVRRVSIPKPDGQQRPLGIPTIKDRVAPMAVLAVLGPIVAADWPPEQQADRPGKSALDAVQQVQALRIQGPTEVIDADLSGSFDSIPHAELMKAVARRVSDRHLWALIKAWRVMPVEESDERGRQQRTTRNRDEGRGTPQGAPLSPLWSNLSMRRFILGWKGLGHERRFDAPIVNDADDFGICCRGSAAAALTAMRDRMAKLKLTVHEAKTRRCRGPDEPFDFRSDTIGRCDTPPTGWAYIGVRPSDRSLQRLKLKLRVPTERRWTWRDVDETVGRLNHLLGGWVNSFCLGTVTQAYRAVTAHARDRLRRWLKQQFDWRGPPKARFSDRYLHETLGLRRLQRPSARRA